MRGDPTASEQARLTGDWAQAVGSCFHPPGRSDGTAPIVLEQVADAWFELRAGFRFADTRGRTDRVVDVAPDDLDGRRTDLASVPRPLTWFVGKYGRHTPAALLHDALLAVAARGPEPRLPRYEDADATFREALACLEVPPLRRTTMWAAVSFGTRLRAGGLARVGVVVWLLAFLAGSGALVVGIRQGAPALVVAASVAPLAGAALWGRQYAAGVVASYIAPFVAVPTLTGAVTYAVYRVLEWALLRLPPFRRRYEGTPYTGF